MADKPPPPPPEEVVAGGKRKLSDSWFHGQPDAKKVTPAAPPASAPPPPPPLPPPPPPEPTDDAEDEAGQVRRETAVVYAAYNVLTAQPPAGQEAQLEAFQKILDAHTGCPGARRLAARFIPRFFNRFASAMGPEYVSAALSGCCHPNPASTTDAARKFEADGRGDALRGLGELCTQCERAHSSLHLVVQGIHFLLRHLSIAESVAAHLGDPVVKAAQEGLVTLFQGSPEALLWTLLASCTGTSAALYAHPALAFLRLLNATPTASTSAAGEATEGAADDDVDMEVDAGEDVNVPPSVGAAVLADRSSTNCWLRCSLESLKLGSGLPH